jgi:D-glycero-alpha-D-manno-heptose-7-phosphate kinase
MNSITVKSPTRVDLAGGTLDLWPLHAFVGPCQTVNVAISIWTEVVLTPAKDTRIHIESTDVAINVEFANLSDLMASTNPKLKLFQVVVNYFKPELGFSLKSSSESPVGAGLGGSSSLMISLLKAFSKMTGRTWQSVHHLVHVAHNLEAQILSTPTGTQDYYPAASGGMNILGYSPDGITQDVKRLKGSEIEKAFLLIYTGRSHHSGLNNFEVLKASVARDAKVVGALKELQKVSESMVKALLNNQYHEMPQLFKREYAARVQLTPAFTSPEIEHLREISTAHQSVAKICGAGGGGCVLVWAPENKQRVADECQKAGFQIMNAALIDPLPNWL